MSAGPEGGLLMRTVTAKLTTWLVGETKGGARVVLATDTVLKTIGELVNQSGREDTATARMVIEGLVPQTSKPSGMAREDKKPEKSGLV